MTYKPFDSLPLNKVHQVIRFRHLSRATEKNVPAITIVLNRLLKEPRHNKAIA